MSDLLNAGKVSNFVLTLIVLFFFISPVFAERNSYPADNADRQWGETFIQETNDIIQYQIIDGQAIYQGDIILGDPEVLDEEGVPLSLLQNEADVQEEDDFAADDDAPQWGQTFIQGTDDIIQYEIVNGLAIYQGDIILGDPEVIDEEGVFLPGIQPEVDSDARNPIKSAAFKTARWPYINGRYQVSYSFAYTKCFSKQEEQLIRQAMQRITDADPAIQFVEIAPYPRCEPEMPCNWSMIVFNRKNGCSSWIGWKGNHTRQEVSLEPNCMNESIIVHELMHAVGFYHEQSRPDRDQFVQIHWENIRPDKRHNFEKVTEHIRTVGDYDYQSIMHYSAREFCIDKCPGPTITAIDGSLDLGGDVLSYTDIVGLRQMYPPPSRPDIPR